MDPVFIDTAGWAAFFVENERFHSLADALLRSARVARRKIVTTNYVLAELSALLISPLRISQMKRTEILSSIRYSAWIDIVHIDPAIDERSWCFQANHQDKDFSLVDCSSFLVMKDMGISHAITSDRHFEQAGFERLLKQGKQ